MTETTKRTYSQDTIRRENVLQYHVIDQLVANQGYVHRTADDFDCSLSLDKELIIEFIKSTQAEEWKRLEEQYAASAENEFFKQLEKALKSRGTLDVLRQGIKLIPGIKFSLCFFKPASGINEDLLQLFQSNILSVIDELKYSDKHDKRIDIGLFVNGIPLATIECKNQSTGTTFRHAEKQYRTDRSPAGEPLLTFKQGALVHFAMDDDNVSMTTRLANGKTRFLPFNRGHNGGAGNPDIPDEFRVAYLYADQPIGKAIFSRDILLDIIGRFMHLEVKDGKESMIFPRFQQLDAVLRLLRHAKNHGPGHSYLIQHSAGSGKSNTIGWTAHRLITLHDQDDQPVFNTAIIVTDRIVLDRQLQNTVAQFEQTKGVVKKIDGTSRQLKGAIQQGARIIITTIHKFSTDHLKEISGQSKRRFAVLIDEAHASQSGKHADNLSKALARENSEDSASDIEDMIANYQRQRGPQPNISYFAFTATPRNVTLERFGTKGPDGLPHPFHLYSMRQAIEEGFILDVLQNYMTYKQYYKLEKAIEDDPELQGRKTQRRVARFATLHPTAIAQKVEVIVEHFCRHVIRELNGRGKAMVVAQSREHALKYYFGIKKYIEEKKYVGVKALVAFSGELNLDGETYTEAEINGFSETQLPEKFDKDFQLLIVAEKYQTGFDQPKLCAMYIDRKLEGLQAVQTLSRLNRTAPGKDCTYVLDFQNTIEDIQNAFRPYYEVTSLEEVSDPNQIYALEGRIKSFSIIDEDEVNRFSEIFYKGLLDPHDRITLEKLVKNAVQRFEYEEEGRKEEFRQLLKSYMRFYSFVAQVMRLQDTSLEKLFSYASWLSRLLPNREVPPEIEITDDMVRLQAFRVEKKEQGSASLSSGSTSPLSAIKEFGANPYTEDEERSLSEIINSFNQRHGTEFTKEDFLRFEQVNQEILRDDDLKDMLRNNPPDVVFGAFSQAFFESAIQLFQRDNQLQNIVMTDAEARNKAIKHFFSRALREVGHDK
ncbi:MAG: type I restriction endonuclease subunit R [Legionellales bacterium]|nr:type I restriction endonuclease subunit R [Legionellales bacterium]